jgi:hypothetical protein
VLTKRGVGNGMDTLIGLMGNARAVNHFAQLGKRRPRLLGGVGVEDSPAFRHELSLDVDR